jgi:CRISPR system Cascade subunit CasE
VTVMVEPLKATTGGIATLTLVPLTHVSLRSVRNWNDQAAVHRAVMALFPDNLPGAREQRRATAGILYRHDTPARGPARLLVQHQTPLRSGLQADPALRHAPLAPLMTHLQLGRHVQFRVILNAVRTSTTTRTREAVTNPDELIDWGLQRLGAAGLKDIGLTDQPRTNLTRTGKSPLWTAQYDGHARVADAAATERAVLVGIGRGKAYGCGLLSLALLT